MTFVTGCRKYYIHLACMHAHTHLNSTKQKNVNLANNDKRLKKQTDHTLKGSIFYSLDSVALVLRLKNKASNP